MASSNITAVVPCASELVIRKNLPCPVEGCLKILSTTSTLNFHLKFFHKLKNNVSANAGDSKKSSLDGNVSVSADNNRQYHCPHEHCAYNMNVENPKTFKTFASVKQHYLSVHAEKLHACQKCGKKFGQLSTKTQHENSCGIKLVCSCGIGYYGKRGLLHHIKRSNHMLTPALKEILYMKSTRKSEVNSNSDLPLPNVMNSIKKLIFPSKVKGRTQKILPKISRPSQMSTLSPIHNSGCHVAKPKKIVIKIMNSNQPSDVSCRMAEMYAPATHLTSSTSINTNACDMLSVAVQVSGFGAVVDNTKATQVGPCSSDDIITQSKTSQTNALVAQDFSTQTEEDFLNWLKSQSCDDTGTEVYAAPSMCADHTGSHMSTQTLDGFYDPILPCDTSHPSTAQTETQTDDWLMNLLQEQDLLPIEVSNTASQTRQSYYPINAENAFVDAVACDLNENNNNSFAINDGKISFISKFYSEEKSTQIDSEDPFFFFDDENLL